VISPGLPRPCPAGPGCDRPSSLETCHHFLHRAAPRTQRRRAGRGRAVACRARSSRTSSTSVREIRSHERWLRSSRPTGPKMRVPRGCCWSFMRTAAFLVEADVAAVGRASLLTRTTDALHDVALLPASPGMRLDVARIFASHKSVASTLGAAQHLDADTSVAPLFSARADAGFLFGSCYTGLVRISEQPPALELGQAVGSPAATSTGRPCCTRVLVVHV